MKKSIDVAVAILLLITPLLTLIVAAMSEKIGRVLVDNIYLKSDWYQYAFWFALLVNCLLVFIALAAVIW